MFLSVPVVTQTCMGFLDENRTVLADSRFQAWGRAGSGASHRERGEIGMGAVLGPRPTQLRGIAIIGLDTWDLREQSREFRSGAARKGDRHGPRPTWIGFGDSGTRVFSSFPISRCSFP